MFASKAPLAVLSMVCVALGVSNMLLWRRTELRQRLDSAIDASSADASSLATEPASEVEPELAPYMARLQALTHKLGLSVAANNPGLARFYLYESREQMSEILEAVPEYRGQPVALLAERFLDTPYAQLAKALEERAGSALLQQRYLDVISACNACHAATAHPFIRIPSVLPADNPYLQTFTQEL